VQIGIGLDTSLPLSFDEHRQLVREATELGYDSAWTNATLGRDPFHICAQWHAASSAVEPPGLVTGISVVPAPLWTATTLAAAAGTVGQLTGGRFILGIGSGHIYNEKFAHTYGLAPRPPIAAMRDYLTVLRALLDGERVDYDGKTLSLHGVQLSFRPPRVPIVLGALGEQMLRLAGAAADGAALNWCTPEQVAWSREQVAEGAHRAGRDPSAVQMVEYIRICVDEDEDVARRAFTRAILGYALTSRGGSKDRGYRGHFGRMGFDEALTELENRREQGASDDEIVEAFPRELLRLVGYYGPASGAAAAFQHLAQGLDIAIVRVVPARPGLDAIQAPMLACRPELVARR
jgi:alkanesulfonate monooxygenase SsuD/methylene tetrahydromethanopterin reductase-like flavin-dependent oxidoreductase (luciferase family)